MVGPWKAGGTAQKWRKVLKRGDGTLIETAGKTVILQIKDKKTPFTEFETAAAVHVSDPEALMEFTIDPVIAVAGHYEAEISVTGGGYHEDSNTFSWIVQSQKKSG